MKEIWKDIPNYEGLYQVSNLGRVKSLERISIQNHLLKEKIFKLYLSKSTKYYVSCLRKNNKPKYYGNHQLVAMAFLGHNIDGHKLIIDHINNVKTDNRVENLQIISCRENTSKDRFRQNYSSKYVGVSNNNGSWVASIYLDNKVVYLGNFKYQKNASEAYNLALNLIKDNKSIKHLIDKYKPTFSSKYKGISFHKIKNKWLAYIKTPEKQKYIGYFNTELDAYNARKKTLENNGI